MYNKKLIYYKPFINSISRSRTMESYGFVELVEGKKGKGRTPLVPKVCYEIADGGDDVTKDS